MKTYYRNSRIDDVTLTRHAKERVEGREHLPRVAQMADRTSQPELWLGLIGAGKSGQVQRRRSLSQLDGDWS